MILDLGDVLAHRFTTPAPCALPVTAADAGLDHDPITRILELRARLEAEVEALTPEQYVELVQYGWPARGLKAVA